MQEYPKRMWINQPSKLQSLHSLHGTNVLAIEESTKIWRIYFLTGPVISQQADKKALSSGWRSND